MSVDVRCESCGKLLKADEATTGSTQCPHCGRKVEVPEALLRLPRPRVAPTAAAHTTAAAPPASHIAPQQPRPAAPPMAAASQQARPAAPQIAALRPQAAPPQTPLPPAALAAPPRAEAMLRAMASFMPWVISVCLHLGLAFIMVFLTMIAQGLSAPNEVIVPDAAWSDQPGGSLSSADSVQQAVGNKDALAISRSDYTRHEALSDAQTGDTHGPISIAAPVGLGNAGMGTAGNSILGLSSAAAAGPPSAFMGSGGNAHHVIYLIDRSGSMVADFDILQGELIRSLARLNPVQDFHVIFLSDGDPLENPPHKLVPANAENKLQAVEFLKTVRVQSSAGITDPTSALKRAFDVLDKADAHTGKLIYLLSDGDFKDPDKVAAFIRQRNPAKDVHVNTFFYGIEEGPNRSEAPGAKILQQIAKENGGRYKVVNLEQ